MSIGDLRVSKIASKINKVEKAKKSKQIRIKRVEKAKNVSNRKAAVHKATKKIQEKELIIIDEKQGLIFENEKTMFGYFANAINEFENKYEKYYDEKNDFSYAEQAELENFLEDTLDDPDEIWLDETSFEDLKVHVLVKAMENEKKEPFHYVAVVYLNTEENFPSFVFIHFPTKDLKLLEAFRAQEIVFHRKLEAIQFAAIDGDSLLEGDYLAIGLLEAMIVLRSEKDIPPEKFRDYAELRDSTIESPDEIWSKVDSSGHTLVTFIKEFPDQGVEDLHYLVITEEDPDTQVNSLLFSFPTNDTSLVDRYRQGENLEAEEVTTESSH